MHSSTHVSPFDPDHELMQLIAEELISADDALAESEAAAHVAALEFVMTREDPAYY